MGSPLVFTDHACEEVFLGIGLKCCGRDDHRWSPPAQNRTSGFPAYGSHLGCMTRRVAPRTPLHPWHTRFPPHFIGASVGHLVEALLGYPSVFGLLVIAHQIT